jgi:serine/threonine protein kinase
MPQDTFLPEGTQLGRYEMDGIIASGGFGTVYRAIDTHYSAIKRNVAIKVLRSPEPDKVASLLQTFNQEVTALSHLNHPHILPIYDYDAPEIENKLIPYIVMPLCEKSLDDWRKEHPLPSPEVVSHLLLQAAEALQYVHDKGIVHKDVKPENFLLLEDGSDIPNLLLADFGIAKLDISAPTSDQVKGSYLYMAQERWHQKGSVAASDQYSLAVMAFQLLTGKMPFLSTNIRELAQQHCVYARPALSKHNPLLKKFDEVIKIALSIEPDDRYRSVTNFAKAFEAVVQSPEKGEDIHMALALTKTEAFAGIECVLDVEGKKIPIRVQGGRDIREPIKKIGFGKPLDGHPSGDLIVTLAIRDDPTRDNDIVRSLDRIAEELNEVKMGAQSQSDRLVQGVQVVLRDIGGVNSTLQNNLTPDIKSISTKVGNIGNGQRRLTFLNVGISLFLAFLVIAGSLTLFLTSQPALNKIQATLNRIIAPKPPTPTPNPDLVTYPPSTEQLVLNDSLNDSNAGSNVNNWSTRDDGYGGSCSFPSSGGYLAYESVTPDGFKNCPAYNTDFNNFAFQVTMTILNGDCGGLFFRSHGSNYYIFQVCANGAYSLSTGVGQTLLTQGQSPEINGVKQANIIAVVANGANIDLYVNYVKIASVTDGTYTQGQIGVIASTQFSVTSVQYTDAEVWTV